MRADKCRLTGEHDFFQIAPCPCCAQHAMAGQHIVENA